MKNMSKDKIVKVIAGASITAALGAGVAFGGVALKDAVQYYDTKITYGENDYKLGDLYILENKEDKILCCKRLLDSKTTTSIKPGISIGNGLVSSFDGSGIGFQFSNTGNSDYGSLSGGVFVSTTNTYGYVSLDTDEFVAIKGKEYEFGYQAQSVSDYISFEFAKENNFSFSEEEFSNIVNNGYNKKR